MARRARACVGICTDGMDESLTSAPPVSCSSSRPQQLLDSTGCAPDPQVFPGLLAKTLCRLFHPTSSVATACGMQALLDLVGPLRVVVAAALGVLFKALRLGKVGGGIFP